MTQWNYGRPEKVHGIALYDYKVARNSEGSIYDLLHPFARYHSIEKSFSTREGERYPCVIVNGSRPIFLGMGYKKFELLIHAVKAPRTVETNDPVLEFTRQEQETKLEELIDFLKR